MKDSLKLNYHSVKSTLIILLVLAALVYGGLNRQKIILPDKPSRPEVTLVLPYVITEDDQYITFYGRSVPGAIIRLYLNTGQIENYAIADQEGDWHFVLKRNLPAGQYSVWTTSMVKGSVSDFSNQYYFQVLEHGAYGENTRIENSLQ